ncbi:uncharacterized protein LOC110830501 [Zootermopsis nevadensis]|uniref:uncharacterized protein LOC110830501 n=1 Tax=Zootermopsis nevadensis TaxID=136037 RepID=UPI000B8EC515|nr:uncharacterized protein LOC110830501 [Zootermopsis nevadensis]
MSLSPVLSAFCLLTQFIIYNTSVIMNCGTVCLLVYGSVSFNRCTRYGERDRGWNKEKQQIQSQGYLLSDVSNYYELLTSKMFDASDRHGKKQLSSDLPSTPLAYNHAQWRICQLGLYRLINFGTKVEYCRQLIAPQN